MKHELDTSDFINNYNKKKMDYEKKTMVIREILEEGIEGSDIDED
jgi:hypothetical protein